MIFYTWKDVERTLLLNKDKWDAVITDIDVYSREVIIYLEQEENESIAESILEMVLGKSYNKESNRISLDLSEEYLAVVFEMEESGNKTDVITPLFKNVLYRNSAYYSELIEKELPGVPVLAFHSYKGGVGRTLSLLALDRKSTRLNSSH